MKESQFEIVWHDAEREPVCEPNPAYPDGIDLDATMEGWPHGSCKADLPYPARRCGSYVVRCIRCGMTVGCTTAGRPDDPRSITMNCRAPRTLH